MSVLTTVKELLQASTESPKRGDATAERSEGAYWCHDCSERIRDVEVEGDAPPDCPECGDEMAFERSPDSTGCAC
jgi:Zn finger protein HypA/HybF involved in hydrogenase expression